MQDDSALGRFGCFGDAFCRALGRTAKKGGLVFSKDELESLLCHGFHAFSLMPRLVSHLDAVALLG